MIRILERPTVAPDRLSHCGDAGGGFERAGRVIQMTGTLIESEGPVALVGEVCRIESERTERATLAEVVGFRNEHLLLMPLGQNYGIHPGSEVIATGGTLPIPAGDAVTGRVIDSLGNPLDSLGPLAVDCSAGNTTFLNPLKAQPIRQQFQTGIKAIDTFAPIGRGQRVALFGNSGVGKSKLLGMIARQSEADVNVIALIGARGRELREFIDKDLGAEVLGKSVVIDAGASQSPLERLKGAFLAASIAKCFRDAGRNVLLMMDSLTNVAMARRDVGLTIGELPVAAGYPSSVFSILAELLERSGGNQEGSITGIFSLLAGANGEPIADCVRSIVDGELVLSRELALQNHFPAIDVLASFSRLNRDLLDVEQLALTARAREALAMYGNHRNAIFTGDVTPNPQLAEAIHSHIGLQDFLRQDLEQGFRLADSWELLSAAMNSGEPTAALAPSRQNRGRASVSTVKTHRSRTNENI